MTFKAESPLGAPIHYSLPHIDKDFQTVQVHTTRQQNPTAVREYPVQWNSVLSTTATHSYVRNHRKRRVNFVSSFSAFEFLRHQHDWSTKFEQFFPLRKTRKNVKCSFGRNIRLHYSVLRLTVHMGIFVATVRFCNWFCAVPCHWYSRVIYPLIIHIQTAT